MQQVEAFLNHPVVLTFLGFAALCGLVMLALGPQRDATEDARRDIRVRRIRFQQWAKRHYIWLFILAGGTVIALAWSTYVAELPGLIFGLIDRLQDTLGTTEDPERESAIVRNLAYGFGALAAALTIMATVPFQLIRIWLNERSASVSEDAQVTNEITRAVAGLGAEKSVKRHVTREDGQKLFRNGQSNLMFSDRPHGPEDYPEPVYEEPTVPNIEVRIGAIYALERIAKANPDDHVQIMEILTAYIRENSPFSTAKPYTDPDTGELMPEWQPLPEDADADTRKAHLKARSARLDPEDPTARRWAATLTCRTDIQAAMQVLGRRDTDQRALEAADRRYGADGYRLDLSRTNLQAVDVSGLNFSQAKLQFARLEGADLRRARIEGADLHEARMEGAVLQASQMKGAHLRGAGMEGVSLQASRIEEADLSFAKMEGADLRKARMEGAQLYWARMEGADLREARIEGAYLRRAMFEGASLWRTQMKGVNFRRARLNGADLLDTKLEGAGLQEARMLGARLNRANLNGANLNRARMDADTNFTDADVRYGAVRGTDIGKVKISRDQLGSMFGDGSVQLPDGLRAGEGILTHWPAENLDWPEFERRWRAWQAEQGYNPP